MIKNSLTSPANTGKLIYGSEVLLIIFAAFLLIAAVPPKTTNAKAVVPVKVNMPAPQLATEPTRTAMVEVNDETQTTAFLAIEDQMPKQTKP